MATTPFRTLVAVDDAVDAGLLDTVLGDPGIEVVEVVETTATTDTDLAGTADVVVVACGGHSTAALEFIARASRERPDRPVVVVYAGADSSFTREVFDFGADDVVMLNATDAPAADTFFALQKALARHHAGAVAEEERGGRLICVLGPKGGIGKTLTSANLAIGLVQSGQRVALVDLDLQFGDLGLTLGLQPERTIYDLATAGGSLDAAKVRDYLTVHDSGVEVLLAPLRPDQAGSIDVDFLRELYALLRLTHDYVVVDTAPGFSPEVIATIDASSSMCMVGMLDAPSLKNTKLGLETLDLMGYPRERIRLLLNRADTSVGISHADVVAILGRAPDVLVPSQRDIVRSINAGEPIILSGKRSEPAK
ncbi:MAG: pilus assembly protein CpaE, partial [Solirubrobacteraceae bacterium]|nr:pilus assembly protein CpaE [Solirubrobacteraceae bacterium]